MFGFFRESGAVQKFIGKKYDVVFFAETPYYYPYFSHLVEALLVEGVDIAYITADAKDPVLAQDRFPAIYSKSTLAFLLQHLQADVVVMTMPDLNRFIFKRSAQVKKYVYLFHALVSTHQQYRSHAFDHYDAIFCTGPHHEREIRKSEVLYGLPQKELVPYGYPLVDDWQEEWRQVEEQPHSILVAPSWYEHSILRTCILPLLEALAPTGKSVTVRPHPEFIKRFPKPFSALQRLILRYPNMRLDLKPALKDSLLLHHHLITDRSGIAFEYAFVKNRPVIFVDTPPKVQNESWKELGIEPAENRLRSGIGLQFRTSDMTGLVQALSALALQDAAFTDRISEARKEVLFDNGVEKGVAYILAQLS